LSHRDAIFNTTPDPPQIRDVGNETQKWAWLGVSEPNYTGGD